MSIPYTPIPPPITVQEHILRDQERFPEASGEFSWLLSSIMNATKLIQAQVRRAGLTDILGAEETLNIQGEVQQKLDVYANEVIMRCLSGRRGIGMLVSEENEEPLLVHGGLEDAKYAVLFDPLDGSSNIDVNVGIGTTFSILRRPAGVSLSETEKWVLQPGRNQIAAGYVIYGPSTILVLSSGNGVHGFTFDPSVGSYILSHPNIRIPKQGQYYSVNEAYANVFPPRCEEYLERLRNGALNHPYASRYVGSMVADFHRTLLKGGVFLYPPTASMPEGKLRLLYEANPVAFLADQAGGIALDGRCTVLDIAPQSIHQRTPLVLGGRVEMAEFTRLVLGTNYF